MDEKKIKEAFDSLTFSPDFQERTIRKVQESARTAGKEHAMTIHKRATSILITAAAVALLAISVFAAATLLTPEQVAQELDDPKLADAFSASQAAVQMAEVGMYQVAFEGIVSGENLSQYEHLNDVKDLTDRSYAVFAVSGAGGEPLALEHPGITLSELGLTITPLVRGHLPWEVNLWTLHGAYSGFIHDGVAYFLFGMETLDQFENEERYFAAYTNDGNSPPSAERFSMAEDGTITLNSGVDGVMFTIQSN